MTPKVRKAVIPAAGLGTRLLPVTKTVPKELLLVVDRPATQYAIEEAVAAGIEEIVFIISENKESIGHYFSPAPALDTWLADQGKASLLDNLNALLSRMFGRVASIRISRVGLDTQSSVLVRPWVMNHVL